MCFGGGDTPQQPVNPAPYPYAELTTKDARAPDPNSYGNQTGTTTPAPKQANTVSGSNTGANVDSLKM